MNNINLKLKTNDIFYPITQCLFGRSIHPNIITLTNLILISPMVLLSLIYECEYLPFILLVIFRDFLDYSDGVVARDCYKTSKTGAILDIGADTFYVVSITFIVVYFYTNSANWTILFICWFVVSCVTIFQLRKEILNKKARTTEIEDFIANNSAILSTIGLLITKAYIDSIR